MLSSLIYLLYGVIHVIFLGIAWRLRHTQNQLAIYALMGTILALAYDNMMIGIGIFLQEGAALYALSIPRFWLHALLTPTLIFVGLDQLRNADVSWAYKKSATISLFALMLAMIALGIWNDIISLDLGIVFENGLIRYTNLHSVGPPIPSVVTILVLITYGIVLLRNNQWRWQLLGAMIMFVCAAGGARWGVLTNFGEAMLIVGLVKTANQFPLIKSSTFGQAAVLT